MTDRQKVTSIREKADPCDSSRNGRDALGLSAGRRDLIEERSSVLLFFFLGGSPGCGKDQGILRGPAPGLRVTAAGDTGDSLLPEIIQVQVRQIAIGLPVRYGYREGDLRSIG